MRRSDLTQKEIARFENKFWKAKPDECWLWLGALVNARYGYFKLKSRMEYSHRISYLLEFGDFDQNLHVLHSCDLPACVNPKHLFLGTHQDNMQDMFTKRRNGIGLSLIGEDHPTAKFTNEVVTEIQTLYESGAYTRTQLSDKFQVSLRQLSNFIKGLRS